MAGQPGPVRVVAAAGVRPRWRALLLLTFALGLTGAVVLASLAGSRRGRGALDEFVDYHRPGNIEAYVNPELPVAQQAEALAPMAAAAGDVPMLSEAMVVLALPGPESVGGTGTDFLVADAYLKGEPLAELNRVLVVDGTCPSPGARWP